MVVGCARTALTHSLTHNDKKKREKEMDALAKKKRNARTEPRRGERVTHNDRGDGGAVMG